MRLLRLTCGLRPVARFRSELATVGSTPPDVPGIVPEVSSAGRAVTMSIQDMPNAGAVIRSNVAWCAAAGYRFPREVIALAVRWLHPGVHRRGQLIDVRVSGRRNATGQALTPSHQRNRPVTSAQDASENEQQAYPC